MECPYVSVSTYGGGSSALMAPGRRTLSGKFLRVFRFRLPESHPKSVDYSYGTTFFQGSRPPGAAPLPLRFSPPAKVIRAQLGRGGAAAPSQHARARLRHACRFSSGALVGAPAVGRHNSARNHAKNRPSEESGSSAWRQRASAAAPALAAQAPPACVSPSCSHPPPGRQAGHTRADGSARPSLPRGQARPETREARVWQTVSAHLLSGVRSPGPSSAGINRRSSAVLFATPTNWRAPTCIGASTCCRYKCKASQGSGF
ncbi:hypothetical protein NDU88_005534 [Pleurodeles waltl]|uniref:Uncharacterized protein n=1 Tax=Pleurodeles waltl TaxID=8319 RepID=A0AAV7TCV5_PLEWA|nr:hypothetical protein NDU88_005534 [Pleurodeles waltl]